MKRIALFDLSSSFRRNYHATANQEISEALNRTVAEVTTSTSGFDHVAVCLDRPPYIRKQWFAEYKAQREAQPASMYDEARKVEEQLDADGFHMLGAKGYEADDILATVVEYFADKPDYEITLFSGDKDLCQLVGERVSVISTATGVVYANSAAVKERFGVAPDLIPDFLALVGDTSDNIPGLDGCGKVNAAKLLNQLGPLTALLADPSKLPKRFAEKLAVKETREAVALSFRLATLMTDAPIDPSAILQPKERRTVAVEVIEMPNEMPEPTDREDQLEELKARIQDENAAAQRQVELPPGTVRGKILTAAEQKWRDEQRAKREEAQAPQELAQPQVMSAPPKTKAPPGTTPTATPATTAQQPKPAIPQETALAVPWERALEPRGPNQAWAIAQMLHASHIFGNWPNPQAILAVMMTGRTMGLDVVQSVRSFHLIKGKASPQAHLIVGLVKRSPLCEYFQLIESTDKLATYETKRRGNPQPTRLTYTIEQAHAAELDRQTQSGETPQWHKRPDEMLRKTCAVQLCRIEYPEIVMGLYASEELEAA